MQEKERRQQRKHFTALTAGFMVPPFDHSNPTFAAGLDARTKLLEAIKPRITSKPDSSDLAASGSHQSASQRMTPLQRLNDIAKAEVIFLLMSGPRACTRAPKVGAALQVILHCCGWCWRPEPVRGHQRSVQHFRSSLTALAGAGAQSLYEGTKGQSSTSGHPSLLWLLLSPSQCSVNSFDEAPQPPANG